MIWLLLSATLVVHVATDQYGLPRPFGYSPNYYRSYSQPQPLVVNAPLPTPSPPPSPSTTPPPPPHLIVEQKPTPTQLVTPPPLLKSTPPPLGVKCPNCTGPDCCELCVERSRVAPEDTTLIELALNPFFYVKYVEDCEQSHVLDNVCLLFVPIMEVETLYSYAQIITYQDGTVEQRQYFIESVTDNSQFNLIGNGCKFNFQIIYSDARCGVYIFQRCFENSYCQVDSGPIQIVSTALPEGQQCIGDALEFAKKLYPCKKFIELPQENASLCTLLGNTLDPSQE